jgi:uncharacterized lipoprotein YbaY
MLGMVSSQRRVSQPKYSASKVQLKDMMQADNLGG